MDAPIYTMKCPACGYVTIMRIDTTPPHDPPPPLDQTITCYRCEKPFTATAEIMLDEDQIATVDAVCKRDFEIGKGIVGYDNYKERRCGVGEALSGFGEDLVGGTNKTVFARFRCEHCRRFTIGSVYSPKDRHEWKCPSCGKNSWGRGEEIDPKRAAHFNGETLPEIRNIERWLS